jgi:hypothetical protein
VGRLRIDERGVASGDSATPELGGATSVSTSSRTFGSSMLIEVMYGDVPSEPTRACQRSDVGQRDLFHSLLALDSHLRVP